jgi:hypothetical protein
MSKTQTDHGPGPDELEPASDGHDGTRGHDDHAHGADTLGPVDVQAWGALAIGVAAGLLIVLCLVITTTLLATTPI